MKKLIITAIFLFFPLLAGAQETGLTVTPNIVDERARAGDIFKYQVEIQNNSERKANIYAVVNDLTREEGAQDFTSPGNLDKTLSLAKWIEFKRGVIEIQPGEKATVDLVINVNNLATPGKRYARIALPIGSNRSQAESSMREKSYAQVLVNLEIIEDIIEKAQISDFFATTNAYFSPPATFIIGLRNYGNRTITPKGAIFITNRRGEEVAQLMVNEDNEKVGINEIWEKSLAWPEANKLGKYKAKLEIEYGDGIPRDLQDTLYFWVLPWKLMLGFFLASFLLLFILVALIFRKTYRHHHEEEVSHRVHVKNKQRPENDGVLNLKE